LAILLRLRRLAGVNRRWLNGAPLRTLKLMELDAAAYILAPQDPYKGVIGKPLPVALVRKLIRTRIAEEARPMTAIKARSARSWS
jgi:hypothetical protein